ncbi:HPP family protein [Zobellella denitrificans]|jgi:CBS-domain-containing membrane protein|uniref:HPP family protein n=1 Tax=Zobellella denitrificans TaxID=347534 RepID=A0A291HQL0_9GAMM|nr:HPP family protein [Zobellella denitrificans]ATG74399.1 HPP family protein [Zobellella denitrificans]
MHFKHRLRDATLAGLAAFVAVLCLSYLKSWAHFMVLSAPLGATLVLLLLLPSAPLSRPRHVILGHLLTTSLAVIGLELLPDPILGLATCFGLGITLMVLTDTLHPPAGANPILIYLSGAHLPPMDFILPTLAGTLFMVAFASLYHRAFTHRRYPFAPKAAPPSSAGTAASASHGQGTGGKKLP